MRSTYPTSLFSRPPQRESGPSAFVVSIVLHSCVFGVMLLGVRQVHVVERRMPPSKYMVRLLDMRQLKSATQWYPHKHVASHGKPGAARAAASGGKLGASSKRQVASVSRNFESPKPAPQTMIQPDVPPDEHVLAELPIPQAVEWAPGEVKTRKILTPEPKELGEIEAKPSLLAPNHEITPSDVSLSTTQFETESQIPPAGTTTPIDVSAPTPAQQLPQTSSKNATEISPARVISMSDLKMDEGTAALPAVNEVAQADSSGSPSKGQGGGVSVIGDDSTDSRENGEGAGHGAANGSDSSGGTDLGQVANAGIGNGVAENTGDATIPDAGSVTPAPPAHIVLPKNGNYGMVIVGADPEEDYAETNGLWTGRIVYTVYLQSDTAQNWILQYSLPRKAAGATGDGTRPDAPWPYDMMRPSLGSYKDVVLVHGFVNAAGRFERLSVAYPEGFAEASLLLRALQQWEFRPAMLLGEAVQVEVLLIVPGDATE